MRLDVQMSGHNVGPLARLCRSKIDIAIHMHVSEPLSEKNCSHGGTTFKELPMVKRANRKSRKSTKALESPMRTVHIIAEVQPRREVMKKCTVWLEKPSLTRTRKVWATLG